MDLASSESGSNEQLSEAGALASSSSEELAVDGSSVASLDCFPGIGWAAGVALMRASSDLAVTKSTDSEAVVEAPRPSPVRLEESLCLTSEIFPSLDDSVLI